MMAMCVPRGLEYNWELDKVIKWLILGEVFDIVIRVGYYHTLTAVDVNGKYT